MCDESEWRQCSALGICWEAMGPRMHGDVTVTHSTYLSSGADHQQPLAETIGECPLPQRRGCRECFEKNYD